MLESLIKGFIIKNVYPQRNESAKHYFEPKYEKSKEELLWLCACVIGKTIFTLKSENHLLLDIIYVNYIAKCSQL